MADQAVRMADRVGVGNGEAAHLVYVLCLLQAAFVLLGAVGELVLTGGNPVYLVLPVVKAVVLPVLANKVGARRRWAVITMIVVQAGTLAGFWIGMLAGVLPFLTVTVNLVGLITSVVMPMVLIALSAMLLPAARA
jgi:hypothetical protein